TFNNHEGSTKSYPYAKAHEELLHEIGFVPHYEEVTVEYDAGTTKLVELHDHSKITLKKLARDYDPTNRSQALELLHQANRDQLSRTGLVYYSAEMVSMDRSMNIIDEPLATLPESSIRPSAEKLAEVLKRFA